MKDNYTYPVLKETEGEFINLYFPTFGEEHITSVKVGENYITAAQDYLALTILEREITNVPLPDEEASITPRKGQELFYVNLWMPYHRTVTKEIYVRKTLTIPNWVNILGVQSNLNFSAILTEGVIQRLGVHSLNPEEIRRKTRRRS